MAMTMRIDTSDIGRQIKKLQAKIARKALRSAGGQCAKVLKTAMAAEVPKLTGLLRRSLGPKVKVYGKTATVWAGAGPRKEFRSVFKRTKSKRGKTIFKFQHRLAKGKLTDAQKAEGSQVRWPNKYAHLAGPRRKARFVRAVVARTRGQVKAIMIRTLKDALESA